MPNELLRSKLMGYSGSIINFLFLTLDFNQQFGKIKMGIYPKEAALNEDAARFVSPACGTECPG